MTLLAEIRPALLERFCRSYLQHAELAPLQCCSDRSGDRPRATVERIDRAIGTVADMMVKHDMPHLIATIRRLEAERDKLRQATSAMDYAKEILRQRAQHGKQHDGSLSQLSH